MICKHALKLTEEHRAKLTESNNNFIRTLIEAHNLRQLMEQGSYNQEQKVPKHLIDNNLNFVVLT